MLTFKSYIAEAALKTSDIGKDARLELFAKNIWAGKEQEAESGTGIIITKIIVRKGAYKKGKKGRY